MESSRPRRRKPFQRQYAEPATPQLALIQEHLTDLPAAREEGDRESLVRILGPLGEAYRMIGRLDEALRYTEEAYALACELDDRKLRVTNGVRLATTLQYRSDHERAEPLFVEALALAREVGFFEDYALQHYGKCLMELGRREEAVACFEEALKRRTARGDAALVASTEAALVQARTPSE